MTLLKVENLRKNFKDVKAVNDITFEVNKGEIFGLLGPNGAGKSTTISIISTLLNPTEGKVFYAGEDILKNPKAIQEKMGVVPQEIALYPTLKGYENLKFWGNLYGLKGNDLKKRIDEVADIVGLKDKLKTKVENYSGGMKRRLGIAQALINNPSLLIVDEPTAGLDPEERIRFRNLLRDFSEDRIVILSTHIVEDVEFTCEDLAILKEGQILYRGKSRDLIKKAEGYIWTANLDRKELNNIRKDHHIISTVSEGDLIKTRFLSKGTPIDGASEVSPSIEDAYMKLVKGV